MRITGRTTAAGRVAAVADVAAEGEMAIGEDRRSSVKPVLISEPVP